MNDFEKIKLITVMTAMLFSRHRVRSTFYHIVSFIFLISMLLWSIDVIADKTNMYVGATLFITDYLAHMYDPHPDNMGPWFRSHFHRFFDNEGE